MDVQGKRVLVVGLARSGRAVVNHLRKRGAIVTATDVRPPWTFGRGLAELVQLGVGLELGRHRQETFVGQDLIVVSPGVPWDLPELEAARQRSISVVPEIEVASWFLKGTLAGITGSNGKTTTASLLGGIMEASGFPTFVGGNIGVPLVEAADQTTADSVVVAELSSFQLEAIQSFRPHLAVVLNITPNHLDRHSSFEAYVRAKAQIFRNQTTDDYAVLNADDPTVMSLASGIRSRIILFSRRRNLGDGLLVAKGEIVYRVRNLERPLLPTSDIKLRGDFNIENVLAAAAAACVLGADFGALARAVRDFRGVEHRLEHVGQILGVEFYNDSKATSVDATVKALSAFEHGVHLILGGKDKGAPYAPIREMLRDRVREVLLIGAAAKRIEQELEGAVELVRAGELEAAVREAFERARPGDVVLLAPACSSYDQFQDFEHRGRVFKEVVVRLAEETASRTSGTGEKHEPQISAPESIPEDSESSGREAARSDEGPESQTLSSKPGLTSEFRKPGRATFRPTKVFGYPERIYVYEVAAEEVAPLDSNPLFEGEEDVSIPVALRAQLSEPAVEDEPLMFEVVENREAERKKHKSKAKKSEIRPGKAQQTSFF